MLRFSSGERKVKAASLLWPDWALVSLLPLPKDASIPVRRGRRVGRVLEGNLTKKKKEERKEERTGEGCLLGYFHSSPIGWLEGGQLLPSAPRAHWLRAGPSSAGWDGGWGAGSPHLQKPTVLSSWLMMTPHTRTHTTSVTRGSTHGITFTRCSVLSFYVFVCVQKETRVACCKH